MGLISIGSWLRSEPAPLLGLDISAADIKLVELGRDRHGHYVLERCATEPLERGCVNDGNIDRFDEVAEALRRVVRSSGTRTRQVAMALPASAVITKKIRLPAGLSDDDLEAQVEVEAHQYIPFSLDEVSLDFCVLGPTDPQGMQVEVLIAASRKEKVQDRQGLAESAGLRPVILDIESHAARLAAHRLIGPRPPGGSDLLVALLELGSYATGMQVLQGGQALYDRDQAFGGAQLTQLITREYKLSPEEAETRLRSGQLPAGYVPDVLHPFVLGMAQEISRALQFFFNSTPHQRVDLILLGGGYAALPGLCEAVADQTSFECRLANPFEGMQVAAHLSPSLWRDGATAYLTASGLAMRRFAP